MTLRFAELEDFEKVKRFFADVPGDCLHFLREVRKCKVRRRAIEREFDRSARRIKTITSKISQSWAKEKLPPAIFHIGLAMLN